MTSTSMSPALTEVYGSSKAETAQTRSLTISAHFERRYAVIERRDRALSRNKIDEDNVESEFPCGAHFASFLRSCPGNQITGAKCSPGTRHVRNRAATALHLR